MQETELHATDDTTEPSISQLLVCTPAPTGANTTCTSSWTSRRSRHGSLDIVTFATGRAVQAVNDAGDVGAALRSLAVQLDYIQAEAERLRDGRR